MTINIQCFEEYGAPTSGRGTSIDLGDIDAHPELGNFNLKLSPDPLLPYYPTQDSSGYAIPRPTKAGDLVLSYKKYLYFKVSGTYAGKLKDIRVQLLQATATQAQKTLLFYKQTNTYAQPDNAFDGKMIYTSNASPQLMLHPYLGTAPNLAMARGIVYGPNETFYTNYIVLQMAAQQSTWNDVGNTAEFQLRLSFKEFM